ncbi:glyoxylate reductase/hydroxypyruvate reductase-like [Planococcus citri]|uniref:glyoxylate reductase/hydroxypyruvate reductase-like n=1 Tax=Planococcus citri TaxID=170843 RepID=UPI0031F972B8
MAKKSLFISRHNYPSIMYELLQEKFEIVVWNLDRKPTKNELKEYVRGKFAIICTPYNTVIDKEVIEAAGSGLRVVCTHSVGLDHMDLEELKSRKIKIGHVPNVSVPAVAEHAIALLLATSRRIVNAHIAIMNDQWKLGKNISASLLGTGLHKSTVAVVGCGRIGISILKKLTSFEPETILYYARSRKPEADKLGAELQTLDFIMKESDFIIVALAQTAQTKGIINRARISSMKPNAILVNIARGGLIDEEALIEALQNKKIGGAGLDVFSKEPLPSDSPLIKMDNVVLSPHIADHTDACRNSMAELAALNVLAVLNGDEMPAEVL